MYLVRELNNDISMFFETMSEVSKYLRASNLIRDGRLKDNIEVYKKVNLEWTS